MDVDISDVDINQCDDAAPEEDNSDVVNDAFLGTHKCHPDTSTCQFVSGGGWTKGKGYVCQCKPGHFIPIKHKEKVGYFNGSKVEGTLRGSYLLLYKIHFFHHVHTILCQNWEEKMGQLL